MALPEEHQAEHLSEWVNRSGQAAGLERAVAALELEVVAEQASSPAVDYRHLQKAAARPGR
jgi:hypothetical protein